MGELSGRRMPNAGPCRADSMCHVLRRAVSSFRLSGEGILAGMVESMMRRFSEPAVAASIAAGLTPQQVSSCYRELYAYTLGCAFRKAI